ncbi:MAG: hypothetical protein C4536_10095 [Actinobacteria bacterium]|jgi:uncharacterized protein (DUF169 family)|nr:MAG: hypothetical protein C4536_10095 [Actinomycetota bacterium]
MEEWRELGIRLEDFIRPATFPVAIRFLQRGEEPPERARRPSEETGCSIALCQGLTLTRERGLTMLFELEESSCPLANAALGWDTTTGPSFMAAFLLTMNYARDDDAAAKRVQGMAMLEADTYPKLVMSPLARTRVEPHLVLVYGNPAQIMRLVHATSRWTGERVPADFGGIAGSCNEGVVRTFASATPRVALPGNGDRVFATTHDDELIFAFPAAWAERIMEGLEATSARGIRYPIPTFINYHLPFGDLMQKFT